MGLPLAQDFPWDLNRGIYLVNGFYQIHYLVYYINSVFAIVRFSVS
jgi:hypothetical protein